MIIKYPLSTEKTIRMMESDNTLVFIVDKNASKSQIKEALQSLYGVKIVRVNTAIDSKARKKAFVKFSSETPALDLATQLGIM